jgi:predicted ATPase
MYVYGSPGCGKTYLMDMFYSLVDVAPKRRVHFNEFMLDIHDRLHKCRQKNGGKTDPIPEVVDDLIRESSLLCFDEFQVLDIADAMVIRRLFSLLFDAGVVVVATSNRPPRDLYKNGLQRDLFVPFIDELEQTSQVIDMDSQVDYRADRARLKTTFFWPLNDETQTIAVCVFV